MQLTTFGNCTQITFFPRVFPVNCYLVQDDDGLTLIDTGIPSSARLIERAAESLGRPITRILLTHAHVDHVGGLDRLHASLPQAEVMISERDSRLLSGDTGLAADEPQAKIKGGIKACRTKPTRLLQEGDRIGQLQVIPCPGHTPGQIAFLDLRDGILIAGDAFQSRGGLAVSGIVRPSFPFPAWATWHKPTALRSAKALRQLRPAWLAVGHGPLLVDPLAAMDAAIAVAERNLQGWR